MSEGTRHCPVCRTELEKTGRPYSIEELFDLWAPVRFSRETFEEHLRQSRETQKHSCPGCKLDIFLPQVIGTPAFYQELLRCEAIYSYTGDKWEFSEACDDAIRCESVIEIGCGSGLFLEQLIPRVPQVWGTEYNESAIDVARRKGLNVYRTDDPCIEKMKSRFDAAFSFHVLEHVPDPVEFIREMFAWVKPDGKIGISVPNMDGPVKYIEPCVSNMPPHHATGWRAETFHALAENLGMKIVKMAFEPLSARDSYYYSRYWVDHIARSDSLPNRFLHSKLPKAFDLMFRVLSIFNRRTVSFLRGQSLYVVMSKH